MKRKAQEIDPRVRKSPLGWRMFAITYGVVLLLVGMQTGILIIPNFLTMNPIIQIVIILSYWALVASIFFVVTGMQIRHSYDKPLRRLSSAAKQVASGDFSVYVEPEHAADQYTYLDVMFTDFNTMVQELGSIETLKNDFVSNVSHEIKTPLAIIKNYVSALKSENLTKEQRAEYIDTIVTATDNLSGLVTNILRLNKLENQEIETAATQYDLCRQLCDCVLRFEPIWSSKQIEFSLQTDDKAMIVADESMLEIVWNNLLSNALKFTPEGGIVSLAQSSDTDMVTVTVTDSGCGMEQETMRHIFDKFYQGDSSHSGQGNGLGLTLVSRIVEKAGGSITVNSTLNQGSSFTVTLPTRTI